VPQAIENAETNNTLTHNSRERDRNNKLVPIIDNWCSI